MASESVSSLILFIAAILVAAAVAGTLVTNVQEISGSIGTYSEDVRNDVETDFDVISDPGSDAIYDEGEHNLTLLVKNAGERTLPADGTGLDVLVNGEYVGRADVTVRVLDDSAWRSGVVAELDVDLTDVDEGVDAGVLEEREHRITVNIDGDDEVFEFYHA